MVAVFMSWCLLLALVSVVVLTLMVFMVYCDIVALYTGGIFGVSLLSLVCYGIYVG